MFLRVVFYPLLFEVLDVRFFCDIPMTDRACEMLEKCLDRIHRMMTNAAAKDSILDIITTCKSMKEAVLKEGGVKRIHFNHPEIQCLLQDI